MNGTRAFLLLVILSVLIACHRDCDEADDLDVTKNSLITCLDGVPFEGVLVTARGDDGSVLTANSDLNGGFFLDLNPDLAYVLEFEYDESGPFLVDSFDLNVIRKYLLGRLSYNDLSPFQRLLIDFDGDGTSVSTSDLVLGQRMIKGIDIGIKRWRFFTDLHFTGIVINEIRVEKGETIPRIYGGHIGDIYGIQCPSPIGEAKGRVRCVNGLPFQGAMVRAIDDLGWRQETTSDKNGLYRFSYSSNRTYDIHFSYTPQQNPGRLTVGNLQSILDYINNDRNQEDYTYLNNVLLDVDDNDAVNAADYNMMRNFILGRGPINAPRWRFFIEPFVESHAHINTYHVARGERLPKVTGGHAGDIDGIECP